MSVAQRAFEQQALGVPIAWVLSCPPRLPTFELSFPRAFECSGGELYVLAQFPTHSRGMSSPERHYRVRSQQMDPFFSTHYKQLPPRPPGASLGRSRRVEQDTQILSSKDAMNYEAYLTPGSPLLRVSPRMREAHRHRLISRRLAEEKKPHQDIGVSCRLSYYQHLAEEAPEHVRQGMVGTKTAKGVCQETKCADVSEALCKQTGPSIMTEMAVRISKGSSGHLHGHEKDQSELSLCDEISQGVLDVCTTTSGERLPDSVNNQASSTCPEGSLHGNLDLHQKVRTLALPTTMHHTDKSLPGISL